MRIFPLSAIYIKRPFTVFAVERSDRHLPKVVLTCAAPTAVSAAENEKRENMEIRNYLFYFLGTFLFPLE